MTIRVRPVRRGVGRLLMERLRRTAHRLGAHRLRAEVSTTARPFFLAQGFRTLRRQKKIYRGQPFTQFVMACRISPRFSGRKTFHAGRRLGE
ncbi:N-acetyltransferase family protein [Endothiovibrio diazotrophicus]